LHPSHSMNATSQLGVLPSHIYTVTQIWNTQWNFDQPVCLCLTLSSYYLPSAVVICTSVVRWGLKISRISGEISTRKHEPFSFERNELSLPCIVMLEGDDGTESTSNVIYNCMFCCYPFSICQITLLNKPDIELKLFKIICLDRKYPQFGIHLPGYLSLLFTVFPYYIKQCAIITHIDQQMHTITSCPYVLTLWLIPATHHHPQTSTF
jgi:hypothetical protein